MKNTKSLLLSFSISVGSHREYSFKQICEVFSDCDKYSGEPRIRSGWREIGSTLIEKS